MEPGNFLKSLRENWFLILFISSLIIGWTSFNGRLTAVEGETLAQKIDIKDLNTQTASLNGAIIEIKANYIYIRESLASLKGK